MTISSANSNRYLVLNDIRQNIRKGKLIYLFFVLSIAYSTTSYAACNADVSQHQNLTDQIINCENELNEKMPTTVSDIRSWIYLSNLYQQSGDTNKAKKLLSKISTQAKTIGSKAQYHVSLAQGINEYSSKNYLQSLDHFKNTLNLANSLQDSLLIANAYNALANITQVFSDYESMSILLEKSLQIYRHFQDHAGIAKVLNNLGNAYRLNSKHNKALVIYREALTLHLQQKNTLSAAHTRMNMSHSLISVGNELKAIELLKLSSNVFLEIGAYHRLIEANALIARSHLNLANMDEAERYLKKNQELKPQLDNNHFDSGSELVQASWYQATKQTTLAEEILVKGISETQAQGNTEQLKKYLNALAILLDSAGKPDEAVQYWQQYSNILSEQLAQKNSYLNQLKIGQGTALAQAMSSEKHKTIFPFNYSLFIVLSFILFFIFSGCAFYYFRPHTISSKETNEDETVFSQKADTRQQLVELMLMALQLWEQDSQLGRIELAEQSKVWKVTIDDGRLRVRAMERYLSIEKLPKNPRAHNVTKTCSFVLANCQTDSILRTKLNHQLTKYHETMKLHATSALS
jgi:tetratricopeptide (TPR) repeat protein